MPRGKKKGSAAAKKGGKKKTSAKPSAPQQGSGAAPNFTRQKGGRGDEGAVLLARAVNNVASLPKTAVEVQPDGSKRQVPLFAGADLETSNPFEVLLDESADA